MSNRQARREQMRSANPQRGAQRPSGRPGRPSSTPPRRSSSSVFTTPFLVVVGVLAVALIGVLAWFIITADSSDEGRVEALQAVSLDGIPQDGFALGSPDAPVKLAMFEDFQCPFCLRYTADQETRIIEEYVRPGKVQLIFQNLPILGRESVSAARASVCAAEQDKFWDLHKRLFTIQAENGQAENEEIDAGRFSDDRLKQLAREVGLDGGAFDTCYDAPETTQELQDQQQKAQTYGFRSTPSFTINDQSLGAGALVDYDAWKQVLDQSITAATSSPSPAASASATASGTASPAASATASGTAAASPSASGTATP